MYISSQGKPEILGPLPVPQGTLVRGFGDITIPQSVNIPQLLPSFQLPWWGILLIAAGGLYAVGALTRPLVERGVQKARTPRNIPPTKVALYALGAGAAGYYAGKYFSGAGSPVVPLMPGV